MNETGVDVDSRVCPFKLQWVIGLNVNVGVVNLSTKMRFLIAYSCAHVIILYDYLSKKMTTFQGHKNVVRSLSASRDGKWLLSADYDEDNACIVWDTETGIPICSLFNPHGDTTLTAAKLSPDAKYIVTVGNEESQILKLWIWTCGKHDPDGSLHLNDTINDRVRKISFNENNSAEFILTLNSDVAFLRWTAEKKLEIQRPKISAKRRHTAGLFNDSCYFSDRAMTVTSQGFVFMWADVNDERGKSAENKKGLMKMVPLQKESLTCIQKHEDVIVIGNSTGRLHFYDTELKLLYWFENCGFDSIVSISFDHDSYMEKAEIASDESTISSLKLDEPSSSFKFGFPESTEIDEGLPEPRENWSREKVSTIRESTDELEQYSNQEFQREHSQEAMTQTFTENFSTSLDRAFSSVTINIDYISPNLRRNIKGPMDCAYQSKPFDLPNFIVSTNSGKIAHIDISKLKCHLIILPPETPVTAIAARSKSDYIVIGNTLGILSLYKYTTESLMVTRKTPPVPNLTKLLNPAPGELNTNYVTCPQIHESLIAVSVLRFSPARDSILVCGLKSGIIWMLNPDTLDLVDPYPYKHSSSSIIDIIFTERGEYFAYSDDAFTVGVFNRTDSCIESEKNLWTFVGKYHSHCLPIREIVFLKAAVGKATPRFLSVGEDQYLIEYDLENSGPYPEPGLKILRSNKIERYALPLCMAAYPEFGIETFVITANTEHKFRLINDYTKTIRVTLLGPTFGDPVERIIIAKDNQTKKMNDRGYMIFATSKEIGLSVLPLDGNPYKITAIVGHPKKIKSMAISGCGKYLFTVGENDRSVFMWKINYRSADRMERLGGEGLLPFYSLIDGGKDGWLVNEMKDLFYYAQILHQGENSTATRFVSNKVSILQLPNLMRAIGFYPTNHELETMMEEVSYKHYAETGHLNEELSFVDFVKLYVNHRPAFGITRAQIKEAFKTFARHNLINPSLTSKQFLEILFGRGKTLHTELVSGGKLCGEPLCSEEAYTYLRRLVPQDDDATSYAGSRDERDPKGEPNFEFLPSVISYKYFTEEILGIGSSES